MSESYKTDSDGLYFVSFAVVGWLDVFTRVEYQNILLDSIEFCRKNKNFKIYCYCIMPSHIHLIAESESNSLSHILRDMKAFTAKKIMKAIQENIQESRREWMINTFKFYGSNSSQHQQMQFWQHSNHAFYLYSPQMIQQKIDYIHYNPVEAGFVNEPHEWRLSSANANGPIKIDE